MQAVPGRAGQTDRRQSWADRQQSHPRTDGGRGGRDARDRWCIRPGGTGECVTQVAFEPHLWDMGKRKNK